MKNDASLHPASIVAIEDLTPTVREFLIAPDDGTVAWTPGSHIDVGVVIDGRPERRSYSLIGVGSPGSPYRIAVKAVEASRGGSRHMWTRSTGSRITVSVPKNHFELRLGAPAYLLVAGGIGVTPLVGMARTLAARGAALRMLYAARDPGEFAYGDALAQALGERLRRFCDDRGERIDFDAAFAALAPGGEAYVCGPVPMLDAARAAWRAAGRPASALRFETFGNSGRHAAQPFRVRVPRHGVDIEVPADRTLLDVLEAAGVDVMSECRRGECGLCALPVLGVEGEVDHRDVFYSDDEHRGNAFICTCVSRVAGGSLTLDSSYRPD